MTGVPDPRVEALTWAATVLGAPVVDVAELTGALTSTMLDITAGDGTRAVLRLMTEEPWRHHGAELTRRERRAMHELASTRVPAPRSIALDAAGDSAGVAAHLMTRLPGGPTRHLDDGALAAMADALAVIHAVRPAVPFRTFQSWAWEAKWVVPPWTAYPRSWERAFDLLAGEAPTYVPTFLHRDFSHRNLLWRDGTISGVVDWVEASTGPAWLDAAHAATNLALDLGPDRARAFVEAYGDVATDAPHPYWFVMDAVGFLPPPGKQALFGRDEQLTRLDAWLHDLLAWACP
ncbi:Phosphotransferase enzyme family protein [Nocardioides lianchengensis]|uniref:Phosphotransferase enzyme family protein n=1 Tax=Nocardioides lianchengensis TaxID=1045774 RepID=A0A1G6YSB0_9ACTN|nr:Phosphotransferase enzyme family protein [Nocardioides lianchengensis]